MNAVEHLASLLPGESLRRLAALRVPRYEGGDGLPGRRDRDIEQARGDVLARWGDDLCALLNALTRGELVHLARALRVAEAGSSPELRARLWEHGAALERGGAEIAAHLQPRPVVLGGHLVIQARPRGLYPPCAAFPRALPAPVQARPPDGEPDTLDELLAAADRALGVRLGARGRDKGAWGNRAARLLGVTERGDGEPDWRGDVELKTVAIAREPGGLWRVKEDPAIAMLGEPSALAKLVRTLWLARADCDDGDATLVAWYLLEQDAELVRLQRRYLHARPKGPANTDQRGLYLHKRFFADAGLLAALNGSP